MVPPHHCANCCLANNPNCVKYGDWPVRPDQVCDGWQYSAVVKASAASVHRHTDKIVAYYQPLIAQAFEDLFPQNALREVIAQAKAAGPAVAKAVPPELVSAAVAALRARLRAPSRLTRALHGLYGDAALQAAHAASEQLGTTMGGAYAALTQELPADYWDSWTPGWGDAAAQAASGGLRQLLDDAGVQIKSIVDTRLDDLGNVIASGIAAGDGVDKIARDARGLLTDPSRALMIADTEYARAMTAQSMWDYQQSGVEQVQWLAEDDACPLCVENEDASPINMGDSWPNGDVPAHPNCRCALAPYVDTGKGT